MIAKSLHSTRHGKTLAERHTGKTQLFICCRLLKKQRGCHQETAYHPPCPFIYIHAHFPYTDDSGGQDLRHHKLLVHKCAADQSCKRLDSTSSSHFITKPAEGASFKPLYAHTMS